MYKQSPTTHARPFDPQQPQRVEHHEERRELMRECGAQRPDHAGRCKTHGREVDHSRKQDDVLPRRPHGLPAYFKQRRQLLKRMAQIDDIGRFRRDVTRTGDGDADVRCRECRRVVEAVTHHRPLVTLCHPSADVIELFFRQKLGLNGGDSEFARHGLGGPPAVSREHDLPGKAQPAQPLYCFAGALANAVAQQDCASQTAARGTQDRGGSQPVGFFEQ